MFVVDFSEYLGELADEVGMADFGDVHITVAELASIGEDAGPVIDTIMMAPAPHTPPLRMSFERDVGQAGGSTTRQILGHRECQDEGWPQK